MQNKNSKSESYIVREAENIIDKYLENREFNNIKKYNLLNRKYNKLKILTIITSITFFTGMLLSIFLK